MRTLGEFLLLGLTVSLATSALGCSEKDVTKCQEALTEVDKSITVSNFALATEWRTRAYKFCATDLAALGTLDKQIVDKQAAEAASKAAEAQRAARNGALLKTFATWAGDNRAAPDHASIAPKCDGDEADAGAPKPAHEAKASERFCTATRTAGTSTLTARYFDADKTIVLFMTKAPAPASCDDIGPNKVIKTFDVPALNGQSVKRSRCELTSGPLSGLNVVVSAASNAAVYVFSPSYLEKDAALKKIAGG